ncbi:MAG: DNA primase large subunit PriL [Candidatus Thermoplasmatota archaeon]|nr:DNA primase large subunit PriL [Candidatus Thermoplasmatota archaeon]
MSIYVLAKYPFLKEAKEFVKNEKVSAEEILHDPLYERARAIGIQRVDDALEKGIVNDYPLLGETDALINIFSYPIARMIVASVESDYLRSRYSLAEAKRAYLNLRKEEETFVVNIAKEFGITITDELKMYFIDYLKNAPTWSDKWKLVNMPLQKGLVELKKGELARLLQENLRNKIYTEVIHLRPSPEAKKVFGEEVMKIKNILQRKETEGKVDIGKASISKFPPCMRQILAAAQSGINVPHVGRFTLVTFLHSVGMEMHEILQIFSKSPDYNEERTRYQIEHITGKVSGTEYNTPSCSSIKTWGLCPVEKMDGLCRRISHPLAYYRDKWRKKK